MVLLEDPLATGAGESASSLAALLSGGTLVSGVSQAVVRSGSETAFLEERGMMRIGKGTAPGGAG